MTIQSKIYEFNQTNVDNAPPEHGVYQLMDRGGVIYIGRAAGTEVTIRSRLQSHKRGVEGACTQGASHYQREITEAAVSREKALLTEYANSHAGRLPKCNDVMP